MKRIPELDGVRALAFLAVFANHSVYLPMAWIGVDLFFVLSGFLITNILIESHDKPLGKFLADFYSRRARRILPPYWLVLAMVAICVPGVNWHRIWWHFVCFIQNVSSAYQMGTGVLNAYWSLAVEEQYYFVWPFLCFFLTRRQLALVCVLLLLAAPTLRYIFTPLVPFYTVIFCLTPFRIDQLAAGSLIAIVWSSKRQWIERTRPWAPVVLIVSAVAFFGTALRHAWWRATANSVGFNVVGYCLSVVLCSSFLLLALTCAGSLVGRVLANRWLTKIGTISYTSYLVHELVLYFTFGAFGRWLGSGIALGFTLGIAILSWHFIEAPILRRGLLVRPAVPLDSV